LETTYANEGQKTSQLGPRPTALVSTWSQSITDDPAALALQVLANSEHLSRAIRFPICQPHKASHGRKERILRVLRQIVPTPEQLKIIQDYNPGYMLIRGAAGSGKTTTALLRLKFLSEFWLNRRRRLGVEDPVRILVLTYNRTLRGYISELAAKQVTSSPSLSMSVTTFGKWSRDLTDEEMVGRRESEKLRELSRNIPLDSDFILDEVDYVLGRFSPDELSTYTEVLRHGRGSTPRVDRSLRKRLLEEVIHPYAQWRNVSQFANWNDLAIQLSREKLAEAYDVIIVDEAQDFSANQIRALVNHSKPEFSTTFILDAAQRIYPRAFAWSEVGITFTSANTHRLSDNHRNTVEIAAFARPLLEGLDLTDDGTLPDFESCNAHGPLPKVIKGSFSQQTNYALKHIRTNMDLKNETAVFLHLKGGGWFDYLRSSLSRMNLAYVEISREDEWPAGPESIALSTFHSAKGLEFDHVVMLGLNKELTPHRAGVEASQFDNLRRLVAMGVGRAKKSVILGFKTEDAPELVGFLDPATYLETIL
jgi:superfamily I DNA/RNA helicase